MINRLSSLAHSLNQTLKYLIGLRTVEFDPMALDFVRRLNHNNNFDQWPWDRPDEWDVSEDLRWGFGVCWFRSLNECLSGLNLCQQNLKGVLDLSGLETLEKLYLSGNKLDAVIFGGNALLKELHVGANQLIRLDLAEAKRLEELDLTGNQLTSLNITHNCELVTLCVGENKLMELDLSRADKLKRLVADTNQLQELDLTNCRSLTYLTINENRLSELNLSHCSNLETLNLADNNLESGLDLSQNPQLAYANLYNTGLTELNLHDNPKLWYLVASGNLLRKLNLANQKLLTHLVVSGNSLEELEVGQSPSLRTLDLGDNQVEKLDISHNTSLWYLYAPLNQITAIDVSSNGQLLILDVTSNRLSAIDVSQNQKLQRLYLAENQLQRLDISHNEMLERLFLNNNPLEDLIMGVNRFPALKEIDLSNCHLPLSVLARCQGLGRSLTLLGPQHRVFFEFLNLGDDPPPQLDLSTEAVIGQTPTVFTILNHHRQDVTHQVAELDHGRITFKQNGRFQVMMTNAEVNSSAGDHLEPVQAFTGWVKVSL